jgi:hypothetical protein
MRLPRRLAPVLSFLNLFYTLHVDIVLPRDWMVEDIRLGGLLSEATIFNNIQKPQ